MKKPSQRVLISAGKDGLAQMTFPEIAAAIGTTTAGVKSSYRDAMKKLRGDPVVFRTLRGAADAIERGRAQLDWFGDEEESA